MLYSYCIAKNCIFCTFWRLTILVLWWKIVQNLLVFLYFFCPKNNWFYKNLHNSGMVGHRKLPKPSLNWIFNAILIVVQYTLSFQWTNFGLKCLLEDVFSFEDITARRLHEDFLKTSSRRLEEDVLKSWRRLWKTYCKHVLRTSWKTKMFAWEKQATTKSSMPVVSPPTKD